MKTIFVFILMVGIMVSSSWGQTVVELCVDQNNPYDAKVILHPLASIWINKGGRLGNNALTQCYDPTRVYLNRIFQYELEEEELFFVDPIGDPGPELKFNLLIYTSGGQTCSAHSFFRLVNRVP